MDLSLIEQVRQTWQFYRDRRPDAYEDLVSPTVHGSSAASALGWAWMAPQVTGNVTENAAPRQVRRPSSRLVGPQVRSGPRRTPNVVDE